MSCIKAFAVGCALFCVLASCEAQAPPPDHAANAQPQRPRRLIPKSPRVKELDIFTFNPVIQDASRLIFVDFFVHDCMGCKRLAPVMDQLADALAPWHDVQIARYDCEAGEVLCDRWNVDRTPTLILFFNGTRILTYKADVWHVDLMFPFMMKMRDQIFNTTGTASSGPQVQAAAVRKESDAASACNAQGADTGSCGAQQAHATAHNEL